MTQIWVGRFDKVSSIYEQNCRIFTNGQSWINYRFLWIRLYIRIISLYKMQNFLVCKILHCMCTFYNSNNYNCLGIFGWLKYFTKYHQKKSITSVILNNGLKTVRTSVSENCLLQPTKWLFLFYTVFHVSFSKRL